MKLRLLGVVPLVVAGGLILHAQTASTMIESNKLLLEEEAGMFIDGSRQEPTPSSKLYWADPALGAIRRSDPSGKLVETLVEDVATPYGMAFDIGTQELLWTSAGAATVQKISAAGGKVRTLQAEFEEPYAIDVSTEGERVYYTAIGSTVYRKAYDAYGGEETEVTLLQLPETEPIHGLALDVASGVLYVGDINGRMTHRLDLGSYRAERLIRTDSEISSLQPPKDPAPVPDAPPEPLPAALASSI